MQDSISENKNSEFKNNLNVPKFIYGTAWKEEGTAEFTLQALKVGFRAIDTANQRKHYFEEGVGLGIQQFLNFESPRDGEAKIKKITREDLFLQSKFTFARGQDHRKPYDESDSFSKQVEDSFASSLLHLNTSYLDSYVLHGPYTNNGITNIDLETWSSMEKLYNNKKVLHLGISNVSAEQLILLCENVKLQPSFVQNRCYARLGWDHEVRAICKEQGIYYQGFSLLTANTRELSSPAISAIAAKYEKSVSQIVFKFCQQLGMICLTGSTSAEHLSQDLDIYDFELNPKEMSLIENL